MDCSKYTVFIVDDEPDIIEFIGYNLRKEGFKVIEAFNGSEAIVKAKENTPQLVLLDVNMPEMDGIETCEQLRTFDYLEDMIIAFLTARGEDYTQIAGFDAGGDDFITKPIKPKVLISRIKALLKRRKKALKQRTSDVDGGKESLIIDREKFLVIKEGKEISLPKKEFELLSLLHSKPQKVFTREEIFQVVWGENVFVGDRTIDVHIRKLREKIGGKCIKTIKGVGYKYIY